MKITNLLWMLFKEKARRSGIGLLFYHVWR